LLDPERWESVMTSAALLTSPLQQHAGWPGLPGSTPPMNESLMKQSGWQFILLADYSEGAGQGRYTSQLDGR